MKRTVPFLSIRPERFVQVGIVASFFLFSITSLFVGKEYIALLRIEEKIEARQEKKNRQNRADIKEEQALKRIGTSEPDLFYKTLETISFSSLQTPSWIRSKELRGEQPNRIDLTEIASHTNKTFIEKEYVQKTPLLLNREDLQKLLSLLENKTLGPFLPEPCAPELILTSFSWEKVPSPGIGEKLYSVSFRLLTRGKLP